MAALWRRLKKLFFLVKGQGVGYAYNYLWVYALYYNEAIRLFISKYMPWLYSQSPPTVEIEVSTRCGLRCNMCEHTYWRQPQLEMSFDKFKSIIDQLPKLKWIGLTGIGDSFAHRDFLKLLSYVKRRQVYIELFDTFYNINEKEAETLVGLKIDKMIASIDGATKETYEKIRVGSKFERITENVKRLVKIKKAKNSYFPEMSFHFIISKLNIHEIVQYVEFVNYLMEGETVEIFFTKLLHPFDEIKPLVVDVLRDVIGKVEEKGRELNQIIRWNVNIPTEKKSINYCSAWMVPFIFASGEVVPCCAGNEANQRDFQIKTSLGNVFNEDFVKIWRSDKYQKFRQDILDNKVPAACHFCAIYDVSKK